MVFLKNCRSQRPYHPHKYPHDIFRSRMSRFLHYLCLYNVFRKVNYQYNKNHFPRYSKNFDTSRLLKHTYPGIDIFRLLHSMLFRTDMRSCRPSRILDHWDNTRCCNSFLHNNHCCHTSPHSDCHNTYCCSYKIGFRNPYIRLIRTAL